jgi:hypothetical protein
MQIHRTAIRNEAFRLFNVKKLRGLGETMTRLAPTKFRAALKSPTAGEIMADRVIPLLSRLERAAIKINKAITKRNGSIQDWIDANIEMAEL